MNQIKYDSGSSKPEPYAIEMGAIESIACRKNADQDMSERGFVHLTHNDFELSNRQAADLEMIRGYFNYLPLDKYDEKSSRYRRYSKFFMLPFADLLVPGTSYSSYQQDVGFNDEASVVDRKFESISNEVLSSSLICALILHDFYNSPIDISLIYAPIEIGIHMIRLRAESGKPGIAVPNRLHKDGEPFTWIHLINREGVSGGGNVITNNTKSETLCETTLNNPLDTIGIVDDQVWHQVKPVYVESEVSSGFRDVILIDFTPMIAKPNEPFTKAA